MLNRGLTLIQTIFLISCICLVASFIYQGVISNRIKAYDTANRIAAQRVNGAIMAYILDHGHPPENFGLKGIPEYENDLPEKPGGVNAYEKTMHELVPKYLGSIPHSQGGNFAYYDYGADTPMGALFVNAVMTQPPSSNGIAPSCRPFYQKVSQIEKDGKKCTVTTSCFKKTGPDAQEYCLDGQTICGASGATTTADNDEVAGGAAAKRTPHIRSLTATNWCTAGISSTDDCYCAPYSSGD